MALEDVEYKANEDQMVNLFGSLFGSIAIHHLSNSNKHGTRQGLQMRRQTRRTMLEIYKQLGDCYFRHAFRMSYDSFVMLYNILDQYMNRIIQRSPNLSFWVHNGPITNSA